MIIKAMIMTTYLSFTDRNLVGKYKQNGGSR